MTRRHRSISAVSAARLVLLAALLASATACMSRHVVVSRDSGVIDGEAGTSTSSDPTWNVKREPR